MTAPDRFVRVPLPFRQPSDETREEVNSGQKGKELPSHIAENWVRMSVLMIRHADSQKGWVGDDLLRPLSTLGQHRATTLGTVLGKWKVRRIMTSPSQRCYQTVAPWAATAGIPVECCSALAEGQGAEALRLVRSLADAEAALCSHGDVIADVLMTLANEDRVEFLPQRRRATEPGSVWVLEADGGRFTKATQMSSVG